MSLSISLQSSSLLFTMSLMQENFTSIRFIQLESATRCKIRLCHLRTPTFCFKNLNYTVSFSRWMKSSIASYSNDLTALMVARQLHICCLEAKFITLDSLKEGLSLQLICMYPSLTLAMQQRPWCTSGLSNNPKLIMLPTNIILDHIINYSFCRQSWTTEKNCPGA